MVSVIVPVYNVERYIDKCIQSVIEQTYCDWELLLIDDGSSDSSGDICDRYALVDKRIKVIHKSNTGVSGTRNVGLDIAQGKYILFLDADDYWYDNTALEILVYTAEKNNLDIVRGEYKAVDKNGIELFCREFTSNRFANIGKVLRNSTFLDKVIEREFFLPLCLIKKESIGNIRFNTDRIFLEDIEFFVELLVTPIRSMYVGKRFYAYRKHNSSISNRNVKKKLEDAFDLCRVFIKYSCRSNDKRLGISYIRRAQDYYLRTLHTMSEVEEYYNNRYELCQMLGLHNLRLEIFNVAFVHHVLSPILCLSSQKAIQYYKKRSQFKCLIKSIIRN